MKALSALILKHDGERFLYVAAGSEVPNARRAADFADLFEPAAVLVAHEAPADERIQGFEDEPRKFGFRWFVPEPAKHWSIWRDVLLASLAIQLIGLATPLFTQVIIDKVVVHHTQSTLIVVAVALAMLLVFNALMTGMRQYLILHTGNRVDAVLATAVFRHLFRLRLRYFERRLTGVTVARLHGVETIREFITGAAISFVLDMPFLVVILGVMFWYSWQLSLIALGVMLLHAGISVVVTPIWRAAARLARVAGRVHRPATYETPAGAGRRGEIAVTLREEGIQGRISQHIGVHVIPSLPDQEGGEPSPAAAFKLPEGVSRFPLVTVTARPGGWPQPACACSRGGRGCRRVTSCRRPVGVTVSAELSPPSSSSKHPHGS